MSRKTKFLLLNDLPEGNRDKGKMFLITELPAYRAEKWAARAFLALSRSGEDVPTHLMEAGFAGVVYLGLRSLATGGIIFSEIEPLLDEMLECVQFVPEPSDPSVFRRLNLQTDIDEVSTIIRLRQEVFDIHGNFSKAGGNLTSTSKSNVPMSKGSSPTATPASQTSSAS